MNSDAQELVLRALLLAVIAGFIFFYLSLGPLDPPDDDPAAPAASEGDKTQRAA